MQAVCLPVRLILCICICVGLTHIATAGACSRGLVEGNVRHNQTRGRYSLCSCLSSLDTNNSLQPPAQHMTALWWTMAMIWSMHSCLQAVASAPASELESSSAVSDMNSSSAASWSSWRGGSAACLPFSSPHGSLVLDCSRPL